MVATSLGTSRGIPGYPGGLPRGSAGEAGPVPPRPLRVRVRVRTSSFQEDQKGRCGGRIIPAR